MRPVTQPPPAVRSPQPRRSGTRESRGYRGTSRARCPPGAGAQRGGRGAERLYASLEAVLTDLCSLFISLPNGGSRRAFTSSPRASRWLSRCEGSAASLAPSGLSLWKPGPADPSGFLCCARWTPSASLGASQRGGRELTVEGGKKSLHVAVMEPLESSLFHLPDYENTEDERFPPLPPPASPGRDDAEWAQANRESDGNQQSQAKESAAAVRKAVKRPMPKLDAQRLISERGLPALRHVFDNVKFKGKGHEAEDLKTLMRHMEHWAHRLFPKLQFEDFIDRVESLGNKKEVQTCLKRIRLDLPIVHEDFVDNKESEEKSNRLDTAAEDVGSSSGNAEQLNSVSATTLTEEQQERIKKNRQLALERRQAKMQCHSQSQHNELSTGYSEEEFNIPVAQEPAEHTEGTPVTAIRVAVDGDTEAEDGDTDLECASEKQ